MKLTKYTIPQAKNYMCNQCKAILPHKQMYNENICEDCKFEEKK